MYCTVDLNSYMRFNHGKYLDYVVILMQKKYRIYFFRPLAPTLERNIISQFIDHFTDGRTPWTGDQLVARPLPKHRTTETQNKCIHTPNIHVLCEIRTHDPFFRVSEDSTCLRPLGYRDRHRIYLLRSRFGPNLTHRKVYFIITFRPENQND
jgi:hypothetical protein